MKKQKSKISKEELALMAKVKQQLVELKKPVVMADDLDRRKRKQPQIDWCGDVLYYKQLDPYWLSTMTGEFVGRVINEKKYSIRPEM